MEWDIFGFCKMQRNIELICTNSFNITVLILLSDTLFIGYMLFITCYMLLTNTWYLILAILYLFYDTCSQMLAITCYYLQKLDSFRSCSATCSCFSSMHSVHLWWICCVKMFDKRSQCWAFIAETDPGLIMSHKIYLLFVELQIRLFQCHPSTTLEFNFAY